MKFDFTLTDADVGRAVGPQDGFLVAQRQTQNQTANEVPEWDNGRGVWRSAYFVLRGSNDHQAIFCTSPQSGGTVDPAKVWVVNQSLRYHGDLIVQSCPRGSQWALTLSDVPNPRLAPAAWPTWYDNIRQNARQRERELVLR
jgi:hypothetical protein